MFGTIRKHQTWLWAIIITLTVISFVIYFSPYSGTSDRRSASNYGYVNGQPITQEQILEAEIGNGDSIKSEHILPIQFIENN